MAIQRHEVFEALEKYISTLINLEAETNSVVAQSLEESLQVQTEQLSHWRSRVLDIIREGLTAPRSPRNFKKAAEMPLDSENCHVTLNDLLATELVTREQVVENINKYSEAAKVNRYTKGGQLKPYSAWKLVKRETPLPQIAYANQLSIFSRYEQPDWPVTYAFPEP